jgi:hypothetical protein
VNGRWLGTAQQTAVKRRKSTERKLPRNGCGSYSPFFRDVL